MKNQFGSRFGVLVKGVRWWQCAHQSCQSPQPSLNQQRTQFGSTRNPRRRVLASSLAAFLVLKILDFEFLALSFACAALARLSPSPHPCATLQASLSLPLAPPFCPAANLSERQKKARRPGSHLLLAHTRLPRIPPPRIYIPRHYLSSILHFCSFLDTPPTSPKPARADAAFVRLFASSILTRSSTATRTSPSPL